MWRILPQYLMIRLIRFYQKTLSFDHGWLKGLYPHGYCRFHPTCSEYAIQAIEKHGAVKGSMKAAWRILRCNPWNKGGFDPV
jgi:putative membrane protein insertion efficiency factor